MFKFPDRGGESGAFASMPDSSATRVARPGAAGCQQTYTAFVKRISCVCGHVIEGEDDDELWEQAQEHLRTDHPDLVGKVSREDILAQAEEI